MSARRARRRGQAGPMVAQVVEVGAQQHFAYLQRGGFGLGDPSSSALQW